MVRRRSTVRFRNGAPARKYDSKIWTLGSENRWGLTAAHRRHRLPASASPVRPCRELRGCAGQSRQILAMAVKAQVTAAPVSCPRSGGPGAGSRAIVWCRAVYRIPPGPGRGHRLDTVRAPAADAGRRQARAAGHLARVPGRRLTPAPRTARGRLTGPERQVVPPASPSAQSPPGCSLMHVERAGHSRSLCQALARRGTEGN